MSESDGVLTTLRELPRAAKVLLVGIALNRMGSFIALFLVLYLTSLGYRPFLAGVALSVFGAGAIAGTLVGGSAAGRFGPRRTIVVSMFLSSAFVALLAVVHVFWLLLVVVCLAGFLGQMYRPAASTLLAELTPASRLIMVSAAGRLGLNVGAAAGPLIGVWLATYSYEAVFLANALMDLVFAGVALWVLPETSAPAADDDGPAGSYSALLRDRRFLLMISAMFLTAVAEAQYQATLPLEIQHRGLPMALYGTVVALNGVLVILVELPVTRLLQHLPMRTTISVGCLLLGLGLAVFGLPLGQWIFFAGVLIWTLGEIVSAPSVVAYPALAAPSPALRSRYIGALTAFQSAGWALGPVIGTSLFQYRPHAVWLMCAVLGVLAFAGMVVGVRPTPATQESLPYAVGTTTTPETAA